MLEEMLEIFRRNVVRLQNLLYEGIQRNRLAFSELAQQVPRELRYRVVIRTDIKFVQLPQQEQPLIRLPFQIEAGARRQIVRPFACSQEIHQCGLILRTLKFRGRDGLIIDRTKIPGTSRTVSLFAELVRPRDHTDNHDGDDDEPEPALMLTNRAKHNIKGSQATRLLPLRSNAKSHRPARRDHPENWIKLSISGYPQSSQSFTLSHRMGEGRGEGERKLD